MENDTFNVILDFVGREFCDYNVSKNGHSIILSDSFSNVGIGFINVIDNMAYIHKYRLPLVTANSVDYNGKTFDINSPSFFDDLVVACKWVIES